MDWRHDAGSAMQDEDAGQAADSRIRAAEMELRRKLH